MALKSIVISLEAYVHAELTVTVNGNEVMQLLG